MRPTIIVIAKAPVAGRVKTRLCPPCSPEQAAAIAEAALCDTLDAVADIPGIRRVLALDGAPGDWLPGGFEVVAQRGDGLAERLAHAFADTGGTGLLVGMDTPQLTPTVLAEALSRLEHADAVLGPCVDGGWWLIGFHSVTPTAFVGVPMSTSHTYVAQLARLVALGLRTSILPTARDVDTFEDALHVASDAPHGRFAATMAGLAFDTTRVIDA